MEKRRYNGYGSGFADVVLVVNQPFDKVLVDHGWEALSRKASVTEFKYTCKNKYEGDDESVVTSLWGDFPSEFDKDQFYIGAIEDSGIIVR